MDKGTRTTDTMTVLEQFLSTVENIEPGLYDVLNGDEARRELNALLENCTPIDRTVLVAVNGVKQPLLEESVLKSDYCEPIPVLVVEKQRTVLRSKPITESRVEQPT